MAKILVVEDDQLIRDLLTRVLLIDGHAVSVAVDGQLGVLRAELEEPELIVMDIGLPNLNGVQATQQIRAMPTMRTTPIIALSAFMSDETRRESLAAGCDVFQSKPIDFAELRQNIQALLIRARQAQAG